MPLLKKIATFLLLFTTLAADAQYTEVGIFVGGSRYKGELSPHLFDINFIHPSFGVFVRRNRTRHWAWKLEANWARVSGSDAELNDGFSINRNLTFASDIIEATPAFEFNFFPFETGNNRYPFTPYVYSGLTVFYFNPKTEVGGIKLQPESTEGQSPYSRISFAIPIGGGIKINTGNVSIALQVSARRTYTDYLDDVSTVYPAFPSALSDPGLLRDSANALGIAPGKQRGETTYKDWYVMAGINIFVRLTNFQKEFCKPFKRRRY
jgi:hypothetical protein